MNDLPDNRLIPGSLPIRHGLRLAYTASLVVAALMVLASLAGFLNRATFYPGELLMVFAPNDLVNLFIGLPILLASMWLARAGKLTGLLFWPGALIFALYSYALYLLSLPFSALFPVHLLLVTLSAYTLIGLIAAIDGGLVRERLAGRAPARIVGGILMGLAILIILREVILVASALTRRTPVDQATLALWIVDFLIGCPALLIGGLMLWRREALGYVVGAGLLLEYGALCLGLIPMMIFQSVYTASPVDWVGIIVVLMMATLCLVPLAFFVRTASHRQNP